MRVYWSHWNVKDRLALLDAAEESIKPIQIQMNKTKMIREIKSGQVPKDED
jgi:hypothetical protein